MKSIARLALLLLSSCAAPDGGGSSRGDPSRVALPAAAGVSLPLTGATDHVHDPAILLDNGTFYLFVTGHLKNGPGLLALRTSTDLRAWQLRGPSYRALPAWTTAAVPGTSGIWAPDISKTGNEYRLYYSVSTFGKNRSAIGLATATTIDPADPAAHWVDKGPVIASAASDDYNAIDPAAFTAADGRQWLVFGSFWGGIKLIELDPATGLRRAGDTLRAVAARPSPPHAIEAPYVIRRGGFYYLFVSFDFCCRGARSTYNTVVGRSAAPTGPYVDRDGRAMLQGGGTPVLASGQGTGARFVGRGHNSIVRQGARDYIIYHAYDTQRNGLPTLQIQPLTWSADGWPTAG